VRHALAGLASGSNCGLVCAPHDNDLISLDVVFVYMNGLFLSYNNTSVKAYSESKVKRNNVIKWNDMKGMLYQLKGTIN
jgi:hypothetical protein